MRTRKPKNGKVTGVKFALSEQPEENDLQLQKAKILKELEDKENNSREWYDNEMEKNLKKQ